MQLFHLSSSEWSSLANLPAAVTHVVLDQLALLHIILCA